MAGQGRGVRFSDSPPGGSRSTRYAYASDSGVGSSGDEPSSRRANPNRPLSEAEEAQRKFNSLPDLQSAYTEVYNSNEQLLGQNQQLRAQNDSLTRANAVLARENATVTRDRDSLFDKKLRAEEKSKALEAELEELKRKYSEERSLRAKAEDTVKDLSHDIAHLRATNNYLQHGQSDPAPPSSSGSSTAGATSGSSKHRKQRPEENENLRERFEREPKSTSTKSRRMSKNYLEPYGPPAPSNMVPQPVNYQTATGPSTTYIPRSAPRPVVTVPAAAPVLIAQIPVMSPHTPQTFGEDGNYHQYPLPPRRSG